MEDGIAGEVFTALGITIGPIRELVTQRLGPGSGQPTDGPLPFSPQAKKVLEVSLREASSLGNQQVGPEHLLHGLVRVSEGGASEILRELGADAKNVGREVGERVPRPVPGRPVDVARHPRRDVAAPVIEFRPAADPTLRHLLMVSAGLALTEGRQLFGVNDLLGALARDDEVSRLLVELGLDPKLLRERFGEEPPPAGEAPAGGRRVARSSLSSQVLDRRIRCRDRPRARCVTPRGGYVRQRAQELVDCCLVTLDRGLLGVGERDLHEHPLQAVLGL